jgi:hypothetical protein
MSVDPRLPQTIVEIDWLDDGFGGTLDDVTDDVRATPGVSIQRGKDTARPRAQPMIDAADVTLGNQDHRYSAENAGSDLYPYVVPDRPLRVSVGSGSDVAYEAALTYDDDATYYNAVIVAPIFSGLLDEPQESHTVAGERHVQFRALGQMSLLKDVLISTDLYSSIRTDEAIEHVLDAAGWPALARVISTGDTTMNWWYADQTDAWSALLRLLETEGAGASLYEDGRGRLHFENRLYRSINSRATTSQQTFDADPTETNPGFVGYQYTHNLRDVYNGVIMRNDIVGPLTVIPVWQYGQSLSLSASESRTWHAALELPIASVTTPTVTTDYVVTSGSVAAFTATKLYAAQIDITITAGGGGAVIDGPGGSTTGPQVRANTLIDGYTEWSGQTAAPHALYANRNRSLSLNDAGAWPWISQPTAQALCDAAANYYSEGRAIISLEIMNRDATRVGQLVAREISDRITIQAGSNEFNGDAWIEQLNYAISDGGRVARLGIVASRASVGAEYVENPALWDIGAWDEDPWGN